MYMTFVPGSFFPVTGVLVFDLHQFIKTSHGYKNRRISESRTGYQKAYYKLTRNLVHRLFFEAVFNS
jgi:hypothetical protein